MAGLAIYVDNDNVLQLDALTDAVTGSYINDATVTVTVRVGESSTDTAVSGITWPVTLAYVAASNGKYQAVIDKAIVIVEPTKYYAHITATSGTTDGKWVIQLLARLRRS